MDIEDLPKEIRKLHDYLEERDIFHPDNLLVVEAYALWLKHTIEEIRLKEE